MLLFVVRLIRVRFVMICMLWFRLLILVLSICVFLGWYDCMVC